MKRFRHKEIKKIFKGGMSANYAEYQCPFMSVIQEWP